MINRRRFLQSIAAAAVTPGLAQAGGANANRLPRLRRDPNKILKLPKGFSYTVVSTQGEPMSDGLRTPGAHDGMAAFEGKNGRVILVCNHELTHPWKNYGPFGGGFKSFPESLKARLYDRQTVQPRVQSLL